MSQPDTELSDNEELNDDTAILDLLAKKREAAQEGADAADDADDDQDAGQAAQADGDDDADASGQHDSDVDDDPEIDLGDVKAKKSEILAWKQGEMKDADYRRKTAEVAEAKRAAQAQQERVEQERSHYANQLDVLIGQMQTELVGNAQDLARLAADDPAEWVRQNAIQQQKIQKYQQAVVERQGIDQRAKEAADAKRNEWAREQLDALHQALPEWRDESVRKQELDEMDAYLRKQGYTDADMEAFFDHRLYLLVRKSWQAEKREAARATAKDKQVKQPPPKALKAGGAQTETQANTDHYKDLVRRAKSGKEDDLMALMAYKRRNA